jgi:hypothetical protein
VTFVGLKQLGEDLTRGSSLLRFGTAVLEERPELLADVSRQRSLEVLECSATQERVIRVQSTKRDLERLPGQEQGQDGEHVLEAAARSVAEHFVDYR